MTKPLKVGDTVEIVILFEKTNKKVTGKVAKLRSKGRIGVFEIEGRKVTAFTSQVVKVEKA